MTNRRTVTVKSERRRLLTMAACAVVIGVLLVLVVVQWVWPSVDTAMDALSAGVVAVVTGAVAGVCLVRRPAPLVPAVPMRAWGKDERKFVRRLRRRWLAATRDAGLTREDRAVDEVRVHAPRVLGVRVVPLGVELEVQAISGQAADEIAARSPQLASALGKWCRAEAVGPSRCRVTVELHDPLTGVREAGTATGTAIVIGRCDDGTNAILDVADAAHTAIQGMTRSGKSALCYTIFGQLVGCPEVRVTGIDPNRVLLEPLAQAQENFVLGADPAGALNLLDCTCAAMDERLRLLSERGIAALEAKHFCADLPIMVLMLEEYAGLLALAAAHDEGVSGKAEKVLPKIKQRVARLVSEGAKAGIRVILITQRMDAGIVDGAVRAQFGTRITMGVDNGDAVRMLHPEVTPEVVEKVVHFPVGRALYWRHRRQAYMQADFTDYRVYRERLGLPPAPEPYVTQTDPEDEAGGS